MGPRVEPGIASTEPHDMNIAALQVPLVEIGDLKLAACRWLQLSRHFDGTSVIKIEPGHGIVRCRRLRLLNDPEWPVFGVKLNNPIALGIIYPAGENGRPLRLERRVAQQRAQIVTVEDVIAEDQCRGPVGEKISTDQKCFGDAAGMVLDSKRQLDAPLLAVAKQALELVEFVWGRDDQDLT